MNSIINKSIALRLNKNWLPIGITTVGKAIVDLCAGSTCYALDIEYELDENNDPNFDKIKYMNPVDWDDWIKLSIRPWDLCIHSTKLSIRVPIVTIAKNYAKMPLKRFKGIPTKEAIYIRDGKRCQYTNKLLKYHEASIDHVIPKSKGGKHDWTNVVLSSKEINTIKGNKLNDEMGLKLLKEPKAPLPIPVSALINEPKRPEWMPFLINKE